MKASSFPFLGALCLAGISAFTVSASATPTEPITYNWTGLGEDNYLYTAGNWENAEPPPSTPIPEDTDITDTILVFGNERRTFIEFEELFAHRLEIVGNTFPYYFLGYEDTIHLGGGGLLYDPASPLWSVLDSSVQLHGSQTWDIRSGTLEVSGVLSDSYYDELSQTYVGGHSLTKTGEGNLALMSLSSQLIGPVNLNAGTVTISAPSLAPLGLGPLVFNGGTLAVNEYYGEQSFPLDFPEYFPAILANDVVSNGLLSFRNDSELVFLPIGLFLDAWGSEEELPSLPYTPAGTLTLNADTTLRVEGAPVFMGLDIVESGGSHKLTLEGDSATILYGSSGWTGGTQVNEGMLIFAGEDNTPGIENGILVNANGYVGIGVDNNIGSFLSQIDAASSGTLGFDTAPSFLNIEDSEYEGEADIFGSTSEGFEEGFDLSNLPNVRLGSATEAILNGEITPAGDYMFGGGGGYLWVNSSLTGERSVNVTSPSERPLTVILGNMDDLLWPSNDFTGGVSVQNSALIFMPYTQPEVGTYTLQTGGYIGLMDSDEGNQEAFLSRFSQTTNTGIIGFDNPDMWCATDVWIPLNFANFQPGVYFGTHTNVRFTGEITAASDNVYRFAGYKGGTLEVASELTGTNAVHIGDPNVLGTFGNPVEEEISSVILSGDNSYMGDTMLYAGRLGVGTTTALGSGKLIVQPRNFSLSNGDDEDLYPILTAEQYGMTIANDIVLNHGLEIGGHNDLSLAGNISGSGELYLGSEYESEGYQLTLSGDNANFSGGIYVGYENSLVLTTDTAAGTGPLGFGYSGGAAVFTSSNPSIGGLWSDGSWADIDLGEDVQTLTINQQEYGSFRGNLEGDSWTLIKTGDETLRFENTYIYTNGVYDDNEDRIGLDVRQGTVIFSNHSGLHGNETNTPAVKVSGGTFAIDGGMYFDNPVIVESGGRLAGFGTYTHNISIGDGAILSPGLAGNGMTGSLHFYHLELGAGGIYEFDIQLPDFSDYVGRDIINVYNPHANDQTLVINADSDHPFIIRVYSVDESGERGFLDGIDPDDGMYSWTLITFDELIIPSTSDLFDPSLFQLELEGFNANVSGDFNIAIDGNNIVLQFTPVPEPSTYALMALGLGIVAWSIRRRRTKV